MVAASLISRRRVLLSLLSVVVALALVAIYRTAQPKAPSSTAVAVLSTSAYGRVLVVGSGPLKGFPLYEFSGDVDGRLGCGTTKTKGYDFDPDAEVTLSCTGPMSDLLHDVASDDWPAFTAKGPPLAKTGVRQGLLGRVRRAGIGAQVTYGGHPLYLFDPPSVPFDPAGERYAETVEPTGPWHGYWSLVSADDGQPAPGVAHLEVATQPSGRLVLAVEEDPGVNPVATVVYVEVRGPGVAAAPCRGSCAATWVPVLTKGHLLRRSDLTGVNLGVTRLANGTDQVTYHGEGLYLYARERFFRNPGKGLRASGTAGNGAGRRGPGGQVFSTVPIGYPSNSP